MRALLGIAVLLVASALQARDGDFDPGFLTQGRQRVVLPNGHSTGISGVVLAQPDGKLVLATSDDMGIGVQPDFEVLRLNADGSPDTTFGQNGFQTIAFDRGGDLSDTVTAIALQSDGKILVVGTSNGDPNTTGADWAVTRLTADGQPDNTFGTWGKAIVAFNLAGGTGQDRCFSVAVQPDGKILLAGSAQIGSAVRMAVARLETDGSPDFNFGLGGRITVSFGVQDLGSQAQRVRVLPDGRIVLAGLAYASVSNSIDWALARLNADGSLDNGFGSVGRVLHGFDLGGDKQDVAYDAVAVADGSMVVVGSARAGTPYDDDIAVARFLPNGSLDTAFGVAGHRVVTLNAGGDNQEVAAAVAQDPLGRIVIAGSSSIASSNHDIVVLRFTATGQPDATFGAGGQRFAALSIPPAPDYDDIGMSLALTPDGGIAVAGPSATTTNGIYALGVVKLIGDTIFADGFGN